MHRLYQICLMAALILGISGTNAWGQLDYVFTVGSGKSISPSSVTKIHNLRMGNRSNSGGQSVSINLPFTFKFDGVSYTTISVSNNGVIGLGATAVTSSNANTLTGANVPIMAPFWEAMRLGSRNNGSTEYGVSGSSPTRIFVVAYTALNFNTSGSTGSRATFQLRLYEGSHKIEFYYAQMSAQTTTSGSIGLAPSSSRFISVTPSGGTSATISKTTVNNSVNLLSTAISADVMYTFLPCNIGLTGNVSEGGTSAMNGGDKLLVGKKVERYRPTVFAPFAITFNSGCVTRNYKLAISGPAASDYVLSTTGGTILGGGTVTPTITFTPTANGVRTATLTISDDNNFSQTHELSGEGIPRTTWKGNTAQGGTLQLLDKDVLLNGSRVRRLQTQEFRPIDLTIAGNPAAPAAPIQYVISDQTGRDQYKIKDPVTGLLTNSVTVNAANGTTSTPVLVFSPNGVGFQAGTLVVNAEGEIRTFPLNAYAVAPGGEFFLNQEAVTSKSQVFQKDFVCAGEAIQTYAVTVKNIGDGDFNITDVRAYATDTVYRQGTPGYPLLRDAQGNPMQIKDYFFTQFPGTAPVKLNDLIYPISIPYLAQQSVYVNFVPQQPGKRFARLYIYTNGENFTGIDAGGKQVLGLLTLDVFGRGLGSTASAGRTGGGLPQPVVFKRTMVGDTAVATVSVCNTGTCDLRIDRKQFRLSGGDVKEFRIVNAFEGMAINQNIDGETWVIPPDSCASVTFSFIPVGSGSRRATVVMRTNDSLMSDKRFTERGVYYWDLYGLGSVGLDATDLMLGPSLIDSVAAGSTGDVFLRSTSRSYVIVDSIRIMGPDANEFIMDPKNPWPAVPFTVEPGGELSLGMKHVPQPGSQPGSREAELWLFTNGGDTIFVKLTGSSSSRTLSLAPTTLFEDVRIPLGKRERRLVALTNTGTVPLRLGVTKVTGPAANDYILGKLPRLIMAPGQTELLEITYAPVDRGVSTAQLEVYSNATNGVQTVALGGTATRTGESGNDHQTSGVEVAERGGILLWQTRPNPAAGEVELKYRLPNDGNVEIRLYDESGREVMVLDQGRRAAGDHSVRFMVNDLSSGRYHYRLTVDGTMMTRSMNVVK